MTPPPRPTSSMPENTLGVVAHGPLLLSRSGGIAAGLRCVFAHPSGLHLPLLVVAGGVYAEAASRRMRASVGPDDGDPAGVQLLVEMDGVAVPAAEVRAQGSSGPDDFTWESDYWVPGLPRDGHLVLTVAWPEAGLNGASVHLELPGLEALASGVVTLLPGPGATPTA